VTPWVFFALVAFGSAAGLWAMRESFGEVRQLPKGPVNATVEATAGD
jgi:hypothetical protein